MNQGGAQKYATVVDLLNLSVNFPRSARPASIASGMDSTEEDRMRAPHVQQGSSPDQVLCLPLLETYIPCASTACMLVCYRVPMGPSPRSCGRSVGGCATTATAPAARTMLIEAMVATTHTRSLSLSLCMNICILFEMCIAYALLSHSQISGGCTGEYVCVCVERERERVSARARASERQKESAV